MDGDLAQRRNLYAKAVSAGDYRTALAVARDEAELEGLYPPRKHQHSGDRERPVVLEDKRSEFFRALGERLAPYPEAKTAVGNLLRERLSAQGGNGNAESNGEHLT